ncbi:putative response regulator [Bacillus sp. TS-2]|nr:putative response regulator [Bacillus sp. TS-2]
MYKVIIVDDEPMIRKGIQTVIDWKSFNFEISGSAKNGMEGLELFRKVRPDLMIIDIKMPKMNGLQLLEQIRAENSDVHVLILSGFADFEYAQKAMVYQVDGYLLKPIDEDDLTDCIKKIQNSLFGKKKKQFNFGELENEFLRIGDCSEPSEMIVEVFQRSPACQMLFIEFYYQNKKPVQLIYEKEFFKKEIENKEFGYLFWNGHRVTIFLTTPFDENSLKDMMKRWRPLSSEDYFYMVKSEVFTSYEEMREQYWKSLNLLEYRFYFPENTLIRPFSTTSYNQQTNCDYQATLKELTGKLTFSLELGDEKFVQNYLHQLMESFIVREVSENEIKDTFLLILSKVLLEFKAPNLDLKDLSQAQATKLHHCLEEMNQKRFLNKVMDLLLPILENIQQQDLDIHIKKMIVIIHNHFHQNIKLESLADLLNYNSAYLGKLFKKYTGEYFNTYLDRTRIEKGKQLLLDGKKVYEVAEEIGYGNVDYFHRKFKKYVGISPTTFKRSKVTETKSG